MLKFILRRRQILLLICVYISVLNSGVAEFESLDDHGGNNGECALLLEGPGRSSAYDYNLNTLRLGNPSYGGPHTCITYDAVNNAYVQARKYIRVVERKERYQNEELATVGELLLEVSRILSRTYGLSVDEIEHGLPLIDTSKTHLREVCPAFLSNVHCQPGKYRRYDGLCNNLKHPTWGAVQSTFARLLKPVYSDAMSDPRVGAHGASLPPPRIVSRTIHPDEGYHDHAATILLISWGQFMDHDMTLTATPLDPVTRNEPEECCHRPPEARNPYCIQIDIPHDDPFYGVYGVRCIDFVRGFPGVRAGCRLGSRNQFNILSGIIDGNTVYGVEENFARSLRTGYGGLLRMNPVFAQYGLHDLLPLKLDIPDEGCTRPNKSMYCFDAGEIRVNEQLVLTCMHTLMAREHNRVAAKLGEINPHWDDETLYQESRRIVVAEIQHITYNEFLPLVLGKEVMAKFGLLLQKEGYWDGYDPNVNPSVIASFAAAAFRFGHSLLPTNVERWSKAHKFIASRRLRDLIRQPYDLYRAGVIDEYFMGMANQVAQAMDDSVTQEVTNHLFRKPNQPFGVDLAAFNMQRGREFGLPSYMEYRKYCGLPDAHGWDDLFGSMNNITVKRYSQIYVHPGDIDLWSGGVSERPLPGAMVGPTFACVIASQFSNTRRGDRFWYELGGHPHSFTLEQLSEIRKARLARIVCDNTDLIDTIQLYPMVLPDHEINPRVPCRSGVLLHVDLTKWADYGGGAFSHQNPVHADSLSLGAYENDPSVGKYVNQDGLQQLRHYLKVGPYKSYLSGQPKNAFFGYLRQVMNKRKRNTAAGHQLNDHDGVGQESHRHDYADDSHESLRTLKIASDAMNNAKYNITNNNNNYNYNRSRNGNGNGVRRRKRPRDLKLSSAEATNSFDVVSNSSSYTNIHMENSPCPPTHNNNVCSNVTILEAASSDVIGDDEGEGDGDATTHHRRLRLHRHHQGHGGEQGESANVLGKMLTRRPVTLIHSTKGHDASNIANVHYTPGAEHDDLPNPGVDLSPRGFPHGRSKKGGFLGPPIKAPEDGPFIPITGPSGPPPHTAAEAPPASHPHQYYDFTGTAQQPPPSGPNYISTGADYEPARPPAPPPPGPSGHGPPPPPPPPHHHHHHEPHHSPPSSPSTSYGDTAYSFKGPLTIYYGFKPVATPYGNLSHGNKEYGSSFKRYDSSTGSHYGPPHYHPHPPVVHEQPSNPPPPPPEHHHIEHSKQPEPLPVVNHNNILHEIAAPQAPISMGVGVNVDVTVENYDNPPQYHDQHHHNQQEIQQPPQPPPPNYYTDYNTNTNTDNPGFTNNIDHNPSNLGQIETNQINEPTSVILPPHHHQPNEQTSDFSQPPPQHLHNSGTSSSNAYYGDYPDFSSDDQTGDNNVPSSVPNYSTNYMTGDNTNDEDLDRNSYKNVQYRRKRDVDHDDHDNKRVVQRSGAREIQRDLQVMTHLSPSEVPDISQTHQNRRSNILHKPSSKSSKRNNEQNGNAGNINKKSISRRMEPKDYDPQPQQPSRRSPHRRRSSNLNKSDLKFTQQQNDFDKGRNEIELNSQTHFSAAAASSSSLNSQAQLPGALNEAMTSAIGFVAGFTEMGVKALRNFATSVNSFANAISTKLNVASRKNNNSNLVMISSSNVKVNSKNESLEEKTTKVLKSHKIENVSLALREARKEDRGDALLHPFLESNKFIFSNGSRRQAGKSRKSGRRKVKKNNEQSKMNMSLPIGTKGEENGKGESEIGNKNESLPVLLPPT